MNQEVKKINGYDVKDEKSRNQIDEIKNKSQYYDEITYVKERHNGTDCYFTIIPKYDSEDNEILLYIDEVESGSSPTKYARDNYTTFTSNATLNLGGTTGNASVIANGEIIRNVDISSALDTYVYLGIKENRVLKEYQGNQTTAQQMLNDGCLQAFLVYYPILKDSVVLDMSEVVTDDRGVPTNPNPRQCLGQTEDGTIIILTCDGRTDINVGLTSEETAELLLDKGCVNAWNLDGGGSSSTTIKGSKLNRNIDGEGTRDRHIDYTLNVKKQTFNEELAKVYSQIGEEKQNILNQLIPYINDLYTLSSTKYYTNINLNEMIGKMYVGYSNGGTNLPNSPYGGSDTGFYFINMPHPQSQYKDLYNLQFFIRRDYREIWTRRQVNGVFTNWWCINQQNKTMFLSVSGDNSVNEITTDNTYQDIVFKSDNAVSNNDVFTYNELIPETTNFTAIKVNEESGYVNIRVSGTLQCVASGDKFIKIKMGNNDSSMVSFKVDTAGRYNFYCESLERITSTSSKNFTVQMYGSQGDYIYRCKAVCEFDR